MAQFKKSQASFFAIAGLIMLMGISIGLFIYNDARKSKIEEEAKTADISLHAEEIEKFANDCIRKAGFEALKKIGQTGGYIDAPELISFRGTSFWYLEQVNIQPFLNQTQERLIGYINSNVPRCLENENISRYGFAIERGQISTAMEFGSADITIKVAYPIRLSKEKFTKEISEFFNTFDIRYRQIFEAATEVNKRSFDGNFDAKEPLKNLEYLGNLDFDVAYKFPETDIIAFTITDRKSITPENEHYSFSFAARLGKSSLIKEIDMQENSASNPAFLPYTIYSVDKKAQLDIFEGTTINLNGRDVKSITVQQAYPAEVTTKDVPLYKKNKEILQRQDIKYVIDNPIYTFEPTGIIFNKFEKLTLYYDDEAKDDKGVGILMGKKGFWVPIASKHEPENKRVFSNILGFTEFTAVYCSSQQLKKTIAEHYFEPSGFCYFSLALTAILIIVGGIYLRGFFAGTIGMMGGSTATTATTVQGFIEAIGKTFVYGLESIGVVTTGTASALYTSAMVIGIAITGITVATMATTIMGQNSFYEESPENCQTFYPMCDQNIYIQKEEKDGTGRCTPSGNTSVAAGQAVNVCAYVKKCNMVRGFLCMPCSVKCTASFY